MKQHLFTTCVHHEWILSWTIPQAVQEWQRTCHNKSLHLVGRTVHLVGRTQDENGHRPQTGPKLQNNATDGQVAHPGQAPENQLRIHSWYMHGNCRC